ncbi:MAG: hypothetical protein LC098_10170 [Burkholderiales bacterium]|nr:hypothetical protein [Burkholderiales bacterium]
MMRRIVAATALVAVVLAVGLMLRHSGRDASSESVSAEGAPGRASEVLKDAQSTRVAPGVDPAKGGSNAAARSRDAQSPAPTSATKRWLAAQQSRDLYKSAMDAVRADDPNERYVGVRIAALCTLFPPLEEPVSAGFDLTLGAPLSAQAESRRKEIGDTMRERCGQQRNFELIESLPGLRSEDFQTSRTSLVLRIRTSDRLSSMTAESVAALRTTFDRFDDDLPLWIGVGERLLSGPMARQDWLDLSATERSIAFQLAMCSLGNDCTPSGFLRLQLCYIDGRCSGGSAVDALQEKAHLAGLSWDHVSRAAQRLARAFRERDAAYFGLG